MKALQTLAEAASYTVRHARQEIDFRAGTLLSKPDRVSIKLTERCNAKCTMCDFWRDKTPPSREVGLQEWLDFVDAIAAWARPCSFVLTGGEPFASAHALPVAARAVACGLDVSIHSNGIYFRNDSNRARVLDLGVRRLIFSIDSHHAELHDRRRGVPGLHQAVAEVIATLKQLEPTMHVTLSHIILAESAPQLCDFLRWARDVGADSVSFQPLEATFGAAHDDRWHEGSADFQVDRHALAKQIREIQASEELCRFVNNDADDLEQFVRYFDDPNSVSIAEGQCHKGLTDILVNQFGHVHFCWHYPPVGNMREEEIESIWRARTARDQRGEIKRCIKPCTGACYRHYSFADKAGRFLRDRV